MPVLSLCHSVRPISDDSSAQTGSACLFRLYQSLLAVNKAS
nr:MAG TPA_asm: hypothetical protein [Caudoviricetes sp.]